MGNLWQIAVVVVLAAVLLPAANLAYSEQATTTTTTENITVQHGESSGVSVDAAVYNESVTISDGGTTYEAGNDYRWDAAFGTVYWPNSTSAPDGSEVDIQYTYSTSDETTDATASIIGSVGWLVWVLVFLTVIGTLIAWLGFGDGGGY